MLLPPPPCCLPPDRFSSRGRCPWPARAQHRALLAWHRSPSRGANASPAWQRGAFPPARPKSPASATKPPDPPGNIPAPPRELGSSSPRCEGTPGGAHGAGGLAGVQLPCVCVTFRMRIALGCLFFGLFFLFLVSGTRC